MQYYKSLNSPNEIEDNQFTNEKMYLSRYVNLITTSLRRPRVLSDKLFLIRFKNDNLCHHVFLHLANKKILWGQRDSRITELPTFWFRYLIRLFEVDMFSRILFHTKQSLVAGSASRLKGILIRYLANVSLCFAHFLTVITKMTPHPCLRLRPHDL